MEKVKTQQTFHERINSAKLTVAVFKTTWCKDCHYINHFMPEVETVYADRLQFLAVDRDDLPELCEQYNILGIPSFIAFREGKELERFVSTLRKTRDEIEQFLNSSLQTERNFE
ncbi:thioredoxin family protein [Desulfosporosinus metallidurans]|uniref:Thioredoxin n=1 Tax=Desulfosporosinus metallidurans TaxID=1888891 RepID=A0A1Q8R035_9FIRM|nr:thioredoxin family protein [Desulfosporosinus metallidurans]OLN32988.1 Thioredoxin [Desulfosporosinus metallidurans]